MQKKFLLGCLSAIVCIITAAAFWPVLSAKAISFDDDHYLTDYDSLIQKPGLKSAWQILNEVYSPSTVTGYYHPLSVISIMLDFAAGGSAKNLLPFHRTNLILHILNTALLIVLLYIIFDQAVPAAMAGLLFGVHPLTVEPVAWIAERKTLLAMFFALWCLIFYVRYARTNNWGFYIASLASYFLAILSKPTSVPLAVVLLVMDYWPLRRLNAKPVVSKPVLSVVERVRPLENIRTLIFEKLRFFILAGIFAVVTVISHNRSVAVRPVGASHTTGLLQLLFMVCYLISFYLKKIIWPVNLSSVYPLPEPLMLSNPKILVGVIITTIVVIVLLYSARRTRVFLAGGLFFVVVISPTLGLIRFSPWVTASDKYVYMPAVGLMMILAWAFDWLWRTAQQKFAAIKTALIALVLLLAAAELYGARQYLFCWQDTKTLCEHMLKLAPNVAVVHNNLGVELKSNGKLDEAASHFQKAIQLDPNHITAYNNLGTVYGELGRFQDEIDAYRQAIRVKPNYTDACYIFYNLGAAYCRLGRYKEAIDAYRQAVMIKPNFAEAHYNLGTTYLALGQKDAALEEHKILISLNTDLANRLFNLIYK